MKMAKGAIKYESSYTFNDALNQATSQRKTLRQVVIESEAMIEDPRVKKGFLLDSTAQLHKARLQEETEMMDGAEMQFAYNGFTALDLNIRRPMFKVYAPKHVPFIYGGGAIETDKGFFMNYATQVGRLASGNNNKVNLVKSNVETLQAPILPITLGLFVGQVDLMKADQIGYDVIGAEGEAVRYSYQVELEKFAMVGHRGIDGGTTDGASAPRGLLNQTTTHAVVTDLETTTAYTLTAKKFENMTTDKLVEVFVGEYIAFAEQVGYDEAYLLNKILVYPKLMAALVKPAHITSSGTVFRSHLEYLKAQINEIRQSLNGPEVAWDVLPYLEPYTAATFQFDPLLNEDGTNNTGRVIMYRQDPYVFRLRLALDLTPGAIVYDPANNGMRRNYIAFIGTPLAFYKTFRYIDNGTTVV
jgi:hypothetical protein